MKSSWIVSWVGGIDWCEGHWCGATYMASHQSILTTQWPIHEIFTKKNWELTILKNSGFWDLHFGNFFWNFFFGIFFLLGPHENQSQILWYNGWDSTLMFSLVSSKFIARHSIMLYSVNQVTCYKFYPLICWISTNEST